MLPQDIENFALAGPGKQGGALLAMRRLCRLHRGQHMPAALAFDLMPQRRGLEFGAAHRIHFGKLLVERIMAMAGGVARLVQSGAGALEAGTGDGQL